MNQDENNKLTYGSIVQLKDVNNTYQNQFFFISYICKDFINLKSYPDLKNIQLIVEDNTLQESKTKSVINEIVLLFKPKEGYAEANGLFPGKIITISYIDGTGFELLKARIINLEEDMITIKDIDTQELFYIDFQYSGLDTSIISNINIEDQLEKSTSFEEEDEIIGYDMEQQINDYINKMMAINDKERTFINKKRILIEIKKYIQLIDEYTDLERGKIIKKLPLDQVYKSFLYLNPNFFYPITRYVSRELYLKFEKSLFEDEDVKIGGRKSIITQVKLANTPQKKRDFVKNLNFEEVKKQDFHKNIKPIHDTPIWLSNIEDDDLVNYSKKKIYSFLPKNIFKHGKNQSSELLSHIVINGLLFHSLEKTKMKSNLQLSQNILTKMIQNEHAQYSLNDKTVKLRDKHIQSKKKTLHLLQSGDLSYKFFINRTNLSLKSIYESIKELTDTTLYDVIQKFSLLGIDKLNKKDFIWIMKSLNQNRNIIISEITKNKNKWKQINPTPYEFVTRSDIYSQLCNYYKNISHRSLLINGHESEILQTHYLDYGNYAMYEFQQKNKDLFLDEINDPEIIGLIEVLNQELDAKQKLNKNSKNTLKIDYVKTYTSLEELQYDENKIILKDPEDAFDNPVQSLYHVLQCQKKPYLEPIEVFSKKLDDFLSSYSSTMEENELKQLQLKLFDKREDLFDIMISKIIEMQVRENERCFVKQTKEYYVYNDKKWVKLDKHEEKMRKKRVLRVNNSLNHFEESKESIMNDYALNLISKMHNEKEILYEKNEKKIKQQKKQYINTLIQCKKNEIKQILYYNEIKRKYESQIDLTNYLSNINVSPHLSLFYDILSKEDLQVKYELIQQFILLLTIDIGDPEWYYCALTNTKLIPKFLQKLSNAYFYGDSNRNYHSVIKEICLNEGTISENGDTWIHKNTGITIQTIYFDTNYGYDSNGFKIVLDAPAELSDDEYEFDDDLDEFEEEEKDKMQIEKVIILTPKEEKMIPYVHAFMNFVGIDLISYFGKNTNKYIKEIYNIYKESLKRNPLTKKDGVYGNDKKIMLSILGFLLPYIQCNKIVIYDSFPGCIHSFDGYPLSNDEDELQGIHYFSCVLEKISKKNTNPPYIAFKNMSTKEITSELFSFIKLFVIQNPFIVSMIQHKRDIIIQSDYDITNERYIEMQGFSKFYPSLKTIELKSMKSKKKLQTSVIPYDTQYDIKDLISYQGFQIQEFLQKAIHDEAPLLITQLGQPFLINYCCNENKYIIDYLCKSESHKKFFNTIIEDLKENEQNLKHITKKILNPQQLLILKQNSVSNESDSEWFDDKQVIYSYIIHICNFDNNYPIPSYLSEIIVRKPNKKIYNKHEPLDIKINRLQENGFNYNKETLLTILQLSAREIAVPLIASNIHVEQEHSSIDEVSELLDINLNSSNIETILESKTNILQKSIYEEIGVINASVKDIYSKIQNYLESFSSSQKNEPYILLLNQFIYVLIQCIPQMILNKLNPSKFTITCKHWDLDFAHNSKIEKQCEDTFKLFESLEVVEGSNEEQFLVFIQSVKSLIHMENFKKSEIVQFSYLQFIFYKLLLWYSLFDLNVRQSGSNHEFIKELNETIYKFLEQIYNYHIKEYDYVKVVNKRLKESEKQQIIKDFELMKKDVRDVENTKKNLGLGKWSYGKGNDFFKYKKENYTSESDRATQVKNTMNALYSKMEMESEIDIDIEMDQQIEQTEDQNIYNEEEDVLNRMDNDDLIDANGEFLEDYE